MLGEGASRLGFVLASPQLSRNDKHREELMRSSRILFMSAIVLLGSLLAACGGENTRPNVTPPGDEKSAKTQTLALGV